MTRPIRVRLVLIGLLVPLGAAPALAQTPPTAEQYQDALNQLKDAQNRKNQLDTENQKLRKQLADTEKKADDAEKKIADANDHAGLLENRAYYLREHYGAWQQFLDQNPSVRTMWLAFFANAAASDRTADLLGDGRWPFSVDG